jgi:hypothetical protein
MARGKTLTRLLDELRAEARLSLNPAHNNQVRDSHIILLQREQERLWEDFDWPHLKVERLIPVEAGQRTFSPPEDVSVDRILEIQFKSDGRWLPVDTGITPAHYAVNDSALDARSWPVTYWRVTEEDQIEVWPIPDQTGGEDEDDEEDGNLKIIGIRNLNPLVADDHRADLDNRLIVLYTAARILAAAGSKDAPLVLNAADRHYAKLRGDQIKTTNFRMFNTGLHYRSTRPVITRYRAPGV